MSRCIACEFDRPRPRSENRRDIFFDDGLIDGDVGPSWSSAIQAWRLGDPGGGEQDIMLGFNVVAIPTTEDRPAFSKTQKTCK